jgi:hypothetical protein
MKIAFPVLAVACALLLGACGPSHHLAEYSLANQTVMFQSSAAPDVTFVRVNIANPAPGRNVVVDIVAGAGSDILSAEAQDKVSRAVNPDGLAAAVSQGVERAIVMYIGGKPSGAFVADAPFVMDTRLLSCEVHSDAGGLSLYVEAASSLIDRATGREIWDTRENAHVPVQRTPAGIVGPPAAGTATSIFNAVEFFRLSDKEIQDALLAAAQEAGRRIGMELREDYSSSR